MNTSTEIRYPQRDKPFPLFGGHSDFAFSTEMFNQLSSDPRFTYVPMDSVRYNSEYFEWKPMYRYTFRISPCVNRRIGERSTSISCWENHSRTSIQDVLTGEKVTSLEEVQDFISRAIAEMPIWNQSIIREKEKELTA